MQALLVKITPDSQTIVVDDTDPKPLTTIEELMEELPDNTPRFVLLSYPIELSDGRKKFPYVLLYYRPATSGQTNNMAYAGAVELVRNEAGVNKVIEIEDPEDLEEIEDKIKD